MMHQRPSSAQSGVYAGARDEKASLRLQNLVADRTAGDQSASMAWISWKSRSFTEPRQGSQPS